MADIGLNIAGKNTTITNADEIANRAKKVYRLL